MGRGISKTERVGNCETCGVECSWKNSLGKYCSTGCNQKSNVKLSSRSNNNIENKLRVDLMKILRGCENPKCKWSGEIIPELFDFEHLNPVNKHMNVSRLVSGGANWKKIETEIAKCMVLCANCHRIKTKDDGLYGYRRVKEFKKNK
jgi:hypothetical protein